MALSERERRVLEDLEQQLSQQDPRLVTRMSDARPRVNVRRVVFGSLLVVAGLAAVLVGVSLQSIVVGVLGVALMGAGLFVATARSSRSRASGRAEGRPHGAGARRTGSGLMARLEQDWERRRGGR
ncbi:DUF3040 domain-containing protein [Micrococcus cohnii]|uniref:Flp pilus assembly protein TadB n=1 Tax=Micrococcus cohnii TaxID=993416 RepID=A0A7W7GNN0_9MICC|nr:DUF3040 domain-containing protein [Micrococcus cohnii]MBB4735444.1 Flp pilus assembly protein TadB [Micrococcus cohnii]